MQVSVEKTGDLERKMTVQVPSDRIDSKVSGRLNELRGQVRLKGFRPGRVPMNIIRQRYGEQVRDEILQEVMQTSLQEAIGEQKLRVAGVTRIEPKPQGDAEFEFTADLEVFPEVPQIEVADLALEKPQAEVADEDIDGMLTTLQEQRRNWTAVERAAADGDRERRHGGHHRGGRGVLGVVEDVRRRLVDRHGPGPGGGVGLLAGVDLAGLETQLAVGHQILLRNRGAAYRSNSRPS